MRDGKYTLVVLVMVICCLQAAVAQEGERYCTVDIWVQQQMALLQQIYRPSLSICCCISVNRRVHCSCSTILAEAQQQQVLQAFRDGGHGACACQR